MPRKITISEDFPVKPADINAHNHLFNSFGHCETEISAGWLVRFAQFQNSWNPFTYGDLLKFYNKKYPNEQFYFNRLFERGAANTLIARDNVTDEDLKPENVLYFTDEFVAKCFTAAGKKRV